MGGYSSIYIILDQGQIIIRDSSWGLVEIHFSAGPYYHVSCSPPYLVFDVNNCLQTSIDVSCVSTTCYATHDITFFLARVF